MMEMRFYAGSQVFYPAAKNMIELSRTQDEDCRDGTTSVIVLAGNIQIDTTDDAQMLALIESSIGTEFVVRWVDLIYRLALDASTGVNDDFLDFPRALVE